MSEKSTAIVRAAEQLIDALIDWRDEALAGSGDHANRYWETGEEIERALDLCNRFRARFDDDRD